MQITIRPVLDPTQEIDLTSALTGAIAEQLWRRFGGNAELNWFEAEMHLERLFASSGEHPKTPSIVLQARASTLAMQRKLEELALERAAAQKATPGRNHAPASAPRRANGRVRPRREATTPQRSPS